MPLLMEKNQIRSTKNLARNEVEGFLLGCFFSS